MSSIYYQICDRTGSDVIAYLVVALLERLLREPVPALGAVDRACYLHRNVEVSTLNREIEARILVLDKVQRNLRVDAINIQSMNPRL